MVGTLQALGPGSYGRQSPEWLVAVAPRPDDPPPAGDETQLASAREMLGLPASHPMELHAVATGSTRASSPSDSAPGRRSSPGTPRTGTRPRAASD